MRGEHHVHDVRIRDKVGIIPACAGSTSRESTEQWSLTGSSPHARGARPYAPGQHSAQGIIPACAGST